MNDVKIDRLKICYRVAEDSIINILRENPNIELDSEVGFSLHKIEGTHYDFIYEIKYIDYKDNSCMDLEEQTFGTISFGLRSDRDGVYKDYAWLQVDNRQFYLKYDFRVNNRMVYLDYIADYLKLHFNNITSLDLAIDSSVNFPSRIIRLLRNEGYVPIINGCKVEDRKVLIEEILYLGVGNLQRIKEFNLLISQKKAVKNKCSGMSLMAYNKNREIDNRSGKQYIRELYHSPKKLYRLEVRINSDILKDFLQNEQIEFSSKLFCDKDFLYFLFWTFLNRIVRFQDSRGRKVYGLLELM